MPHFNEVREIHTSGLIVCPFPNSFYCYSWLSEINDAEQVF